MLFNSQWIDLKHMLPWYRVKEQKTAIRGILEQKRRILTAEQIAHESEQVIAQIEKMSHFQQARVVMVYYPIHHELSLLPLVEKYKDQKTFLFPITHRNGIEVRPYEGEEKMKKGKFHIPEPQTAAYKGSIDLILIPGVGFDHHCNRLGRGGGYYDRFLSKQKKTFQIGVAYEFQLQSSELPHTRCDHRLNRVVTPTRIINA